MNAAVLDTCVIFKWFHHKNEEGVDAALLLRDAWLGGALEITVPDLLVCELANTFRYKEPLKPEDADAALGSFWSLGPSIYAVDETLSRSAVRLAYDCEITAYDATFLALSVLLQVPLITADRSLYRRVKDRHAVMLLTDIAGQP